MPTISKFLRAAPCALALFLVAAGPARAAEARPVGALGRLQPTDGLVELGAAGEVVAELLVSVGDVVEARQPLVRLAGRDAAELELRLARAALREAEENGPQNVLAKELSLKQAESDLALAKERLERYLKLNGSSISPQETDLRRHQVEAAATQREAAQAALAIARTTAETSVEKARVQTAQAEKKVSSATLVAPSAGTVLELNAVVGGRAGPLVAKLADLRRMMVVADVFESELGRLRPGAACEIRHDALGRDPLPGKLVRVGRVVSNPGKVAQVWIELERAEPADRFIGMEVNVSILP